MRRSIAKFLRLALLTLALLLTLPLPALAAPRADETVHLPLVAGGSGPPVGVVILSVQGWQSSTTAYRVVGEVVNNTGGNVRSVRVDIAVRDAGGAVMQSDYAYADVRVLGPGMKSPFDEIFLNLPAPVASISAEVTWAHTFDAAIQLEVVSQASSFNAGGAFVVNGRARNPYAFTVEAEAIVTMYDAAGKVIGVERESNPPPLPPGVSADFEVIVSNWIGRPDAGKVAGYAVVVTKE